MSESRVHLIDTTAFLHRAMHVVYRDTASEMPAEDEGLVRHACLMLSNLCRELGIQRLILAQDSGEPSLRVDEFVEYRQGRKQYPPVLESSIPRFYTHMTAVGVPVVGWARYEADDVIASLVADDECENAVVVSSDKDLLQLVTETKDRPGVSVYDPMQKRWFRVADVVEKMGVAPRQIPDYIGLVGDTSDNIPGVRGIGHVGATNILREFDTLENVYDPDRRLALEEYLSSAKKVAKLYGEKEAAFLSRSLARPRIRADVSAREVLRAGKWLGDFEALRWPG